MKDPCVVTCGRNIRSMSVDNQVVPFGLNQWQQFSAKIGEIACEFGVDPHAFTVDLPSGQIIDRVTSCPDLAELAKRLDRNAWVIYFAARECNLTASEIIWCLVSSGDRQLRMKTLKGVVITPEEVSSFINTTTRINSW